MKIISLNGPPGCGKDTAANFLVKEFGFRHLKYAAALKNGAHALLGLTGVEHDSFEEVKEDNRSEFFGYTPREFYIALSETFLKPMTRDKWGDTAFGHILVNQLKDLPRNANVVISDSGFAEEAVPVINFVNEQNFMLMRIFREGHDFGHDSRSYWDVRSIAVDYGVSPGWINIVKNNGTFEEFERWITSAAEAFIDA